SVRILNARQRIPAYDLVGRRIDDKQKIYAVDCYQDVSRFLIVDSVSSSAAARNFCSQSVTGGVDHRIYAAVLVGDKHLVLLWSVGQAVRVGDRSGGSQSL